MNIAFFLTPKSSVVWLRARSTVRQAMEKMEAHRYSAIPLVDDDGCYVGTLTEGDLLWWMKRCERPWAVLAEHTHVLEIPHWVSNEPVRMDAEVEQLVALAAEQNFVPVVDDRGVFVGIVRRQRIIEHLLRSGALGGWETTGRACLSFHRTSEDIQVRSVGGR